MRRSVSVRVAALVLVISMAAPAFAARRDDSPIGGFDRIERRIASFVRHVIHILDLSQLDPPK